MTELRLDADHHLRRALPSDAAAFYRICLQTGDAGRDATADHDDPDLLGAFYVGPYLAFEPDLAFALEGPEGVAGYLLGARDTADFAARVEAEWLPPLRRANRDPGPDEAAWRGSDWVRRRLHHPEIAVPALLIAWPAHGHMDLLPPVQGRGFGRAALTFLMDRLAAAGAPGLHLQVSPENAGALAFYRKLGFDRAAGPGLPDHTIFMVRRLVAAPP